MTLAGAAFFYESLLLLIYTALFSLITHLFVALHAEPTLHELSAMNTKCIAAESDGGDQKIRSKN